MGQDAFSELFTPHNSQGLPLDTVRELRYENQ
jgi:hypothetical protein